MLSGILEWFDARLGFWNHQPAFLKGFLERHVPKGVNWAYTLGSATTVAFIILVVTGMLLSMYYQGAPQVAYDSLKYVDQHVFLGSVIHNLHHWTASAMVILVVLHMMRVFFWGAYKFPRELTWLTGCFLLLVTLAYAFTGYLLPYDQKAYWTTVLLSRMVETVPWFGEWAKTLVQAGPEISSRTLTALYGFHTWILTAITVIFVVVHVMLVIRIGISNPPRKSDEPYASESDPKTAYQKFYLAAKKAGAPFYHNILEDAFVSLGIVALLLIAAVFWADPVGDPANPLGNGFAPRPEWYFSWLFQMLRFFPGKLEFVGVVVVPIVLVLLLLAIPFLDKSPRRHPLSRPLATGLWTGAWIVIAILEYGGLTQPVHGKTTDVPVAKAFSDQAKSGWKAFNTYGCINCHQIGNAGTPVGPALTDVGAKRDHAYLAKWVRDPASLKPGAAMMGFPQIPAKDFEDLITFLSELK